MTSKNQSGQGNIQCFNFDKMDKENISPEDMVVEFYTQVVSYYKLVYLKVYMFISNLFL